MAGAVRLCGAYTKGKPAMRRQKTSWDYFCDLVVAVPGVTGMFDDARLDRTVRGEREGDGKSGKIATLNVPGRDGDRPATEERAL